MFFRLILSCFCICILALMSVRGLALASTPPISPFAYIISSPNDFSARDVMLYDPQTGVSFSLLHRPTRFGELTLAPDGNYLAYTEPLLGIYTVDILGGKPTAIVRGYVGLPLWSPDNEHLLFIDDLDLTLFSFATQETTILMPLRVATSWLPDGERIAYSEFNPETRLYDIRIQSLNDTSTTTLFSTDDLIVHLSFSPDETWLAYSVLTGNVTLREIATGTEIVIEDEGNHFAPQWSSDGNYLLFIRTFPRQTMIDIAVANRLGEIIFVHEPRGLTLESSVLWWRN
jgi:Tol biopolymer transport system component